MRLSRVELKKPSLIVFVIALVLAAIVLLMALDFFNLESYDPLNNGGFYFDYSWKGRMFLLLFVAIFILEYITNRGIQKVGSTESKRRHLLRTFIVLICASIPLMWIISENFMGFSDVVVAAGDGLRGDYWRAVLANNPNDPNSINNFLAGDWPLSIQYIIFALSVLSALFFGYGQKGLKAFSLSLALVGGIGFVFLIDTLFPYGALEPLQLMTLPTSSCAAGMLNFLGFKVTLTYTPTFQSSPVITVFPDGSASSASINWPCAGIHSLFLFTLIMILLLRKCDMSLFRKTVYFIFGFVVTYFVNVLRIVFYFIILYFDGGAAAIVYHSDYGELLFIGWMGMYILLIACIEKLSLKEKIEHRLHYIKCF